MKKVMIITAMFMATNVWSNLVGYEVCQSRDLENLERCAKNLIGRGDKPVGNIVVIKASSFADEYYQALWRDDR